MSNNGSNNGGTLDERLFGVLGQYRGNRAAYAWLAALFEGEGCFSLHVNHKKYGSYRLVLDLTMGCEEDIRVAQEIIFDITHRKPDIKVRRYKHTKNPMFNLRVYRQKDCRKVCEALLPFLRGKKEQAEIIIAFCRVRMEAKHRRGKLGQQEPCVAGLVEQMSRARQEFYGAPPEVVEAEPSALVN